MVKLLVALVLGGTRQPQAQLGIGGAVRGGEDDGRVGLALPQHVQAVQRPGRQGDGGGGDRQGDEHLVAVQTGVAAAQVAHF